MNARFLAIDTATEIGSVAVGSVGHIVAERMMGARQHAAQILVVIDQVLRVAETRRDQLAGIIVGDGPGSFTGLRIAWATAKGLAHERGLPLIAVPSLMGAAAASRESGEGPVAACFDALRGQVFGALYTFSASRVDTIVAPGLFTVPELARVAPVRPLLAVGDGARRYPDDVEKWTGRPPLGLEQLPPIAATLLALASQEGAARELQDPSTAEPVYGRPAEAQVKWEARHGRPLPHSSR